MPHRRGRPSCSRTPATALSTTLSTSASVSLTPCMTHFVLSTPSQGGRRSRRTCCRNAECVVGGKAAVASIVGGMPSGVEGADFNESSGGERARGTRQTRRCPTAARPSTR
eukprot:6191618-Pleurochrysis_carterae.AAC.1